MGSNDRFTLVYMKEVTVQNKNYTTSGVKQTTAYKQTGMDVCYQHIFKGISDVTLSRGCQEQVMSES